MEKLTIGESFRIALKRAGKTMDDIAKALGVDRRNVSQTFQKYDKNNGNISNLIKYVEAIGFELEFVFKNVKKEKEEEEIFSMIIKHLTGNWSFFNSENMEIGIKDMTKVSEKVKKMFMDKGVILCPEKTEDRIL